MSLVLISSVLISCNKKNLHKIIDVAERFYCPHECGPNLSCPILCSGIATVVSTLNTLQSSFEHIFLIQTGFNFTALFTGIIGINCQRHTRTNNAHYISGIKAPSKKEMIFKLLSIINSGISLYISCSSDNPNQFSAALNVCNGLFSSMNIAGVSAITMRDLYGNSYPIEKIENNV